jgi:AcrR family transcriptional regulator
MRNGLASSVQTRILDAAVELFAEKGFDGASVQEIVDRAAVTKGALYHYFVCKEDLLYEIYHSLTSVQQAEMGRILDSRLPSPEAIRAIVVNLVETTTAHLAESAVLAREMHKLGGERMAAVRSERQVYHEAFRQVVERGQREGTFADVPSAETVTLMVFGAINQLPQRYRPDGPQSPRQLGTEIADFVLAGLQVGVNPRATFTAATST